MKKFLSAAIVLLIVCMMGCMAVLAEEPCDHNWSAVKQPNCTENGARGCSACGATESIPAKGHTEETVAGKDATCTATGLTAGTKCSVCGVTVKAQEEIAAKGHNWSAVKQPNCTENGARGCSACGATESIPAKGHTEETVAGKDATCTATGLTAGTKCSVCGVTVKAQGEIAAKGHNWSQEKAPTCTENGARGCSACGATESIPAKGHTEETVAGKDATCTATGLTAGTKCSVCGETVKAQEEIAAKGHTEEIVAGKDATCTATGLTAGIKCSVCGETLKAQEEIPAKGHNWKNGKCTVCGAGDPNYVKPQPPVVTPKPTPVPTPVPTPNTWLYNNTITSYGPTTRELIGGKAWHRVTPVDVSVDGVYTYDLIASNRYVVGTVTFKVEAGALTVSYKVKANPFDVTDEQLKIYASKADLAEGKAVAANVGEAVNIAENFGTDTKVIVSLILTGDYDTEGHYVVGMTIVEKEIAAMIASMD